MPTVVRATDETIPPFPLFLAAGALVLVFAFATVHHRPGTQLAASFASARSHAVITNWMNGGYVAAYGLMMVSPGNRSQIYDSSTGGYMLSGFLLERAWMAVRGQYSWRLLAVHNELVALLSASLLALLAYRLARRQGLEPLHALVLGLAVEVVQLTFPDNLATYWEINAQAYALLFAVVFLLLEERAIDGRTRLLTLGQAASMFALTYMEYICGVMFLVAFVATSLLLRSERPLRRLALVALLPCVAALGLFGLQRLGLKHLEAGGAVTTAGSGFLFRTGLDGDATYYGDSLGIAFRRDVARANFSRNREALFRWPALFVAGVLALLATFAAYTRDLVPRIAVEVLASLTGSYVLYAALFSQAVVIHPYLYDGLLAAPMILGAFAVVPALLERWAGGRGVVVLIAAFWSCWMGFFQLRLYALWFPLAAGHA